MSAKRIVIIDDDFIVREIIKKSIQQNADVSVNVFSSSNGVEGLGLIELENPDLVILDTTLPKFNGAELLDILSKRSNLKIILLHEDATFPENIQSNVAKLDKSNPDFIDNLNDELKKFFARSYENKKNGFHRRVARKLILRSNNKDVLVHRMTKEGRYFNVFYWIKLFLTELYLSILLTIFYITSGGRIKDSNFSQKVIDRKAYAVRYYPSIFVLIFGFVFLVGFIMFGVSYVGGRIRFLSAQQVCPLPAAPSIINNQITVTPDNIDGIVDCISLDIIVGPTGEVILESYKNDNDELSGDWGVTLLVNNLTVQEGGRIHADGKGYTVLDSEYANGKGGNSSGQTGGAGGGHGGAGGQGFEDSENPSGFGGSTYGSSGQPVTLGSPGGNGGDHSDTFSRTWSNGLFNAENTNYTSGIHTPGSGLELVANDSVYASGDQAWTSQSFSVSNTKNIAIENINLDWVLDGSDNIAPKVQLLGSNTGDFAGEEITYPSASTYFQNGGDFSINDGVASSVTGVVNARYKFWKVKIYLNTGANTSDTPRINSLTLAGNSKEINEATGGAGGGAIRITVENNLTLNGIISANGLFGSANSTTSGGGGSGGSVWIVAENFSGYGSVRANGGGAANVQYQGGGGGGGRVVMICNTNNTFTGTATATQGITESSQDGGVGTVVGPTCKPSIPTILRQFNSNGSIEIPAGGSLSSNAVMVGVNMTDSDASDKLTLQVEFKKLGEDFTGIPTHVQSSPANNPQNCAGSYTTCGRVTITGLDRSTEYHWRARVRDSKGALSDWVSFGNNDENEKDIRLLGDPSTVTLVSGNNQSAIVGQSIEESMVVIVKDASEFAIPDINVTWAVTAGGGIIGTSVVKTTSDGQSSQTLQVGTISGSNNQTVTATVSGLPAVTFTHSATPGDATALIATTPSVAITNEEFAVTLTAYDQYSNVATGFTGTVSLAPVDPNNTASVRSGTLSPSTTEFAGEDSGVKTISNVSYDTQESIKIRFSVGGITTYSNTIAIVNELGSCPDADGIIDNGGPVAWDASAFPGGVIDCRGLTIHVKNSGGGAATFLSINSYSTSPTTPVGATLIADNLIVDSGNALTVDAKGFAVNAGPGAGGSNAFGGGHGGFNGNKTPYGSIKEPVTLGSGGSTGAGGGALKLEIENTLTVNGTISANGGGSTSGTTSGGAGGSIWIITDVLDGAGLISANGGAYGGAGGRVAIYRNSGNLSLYTKANVQAFGRQPNGSAGRNAGAGTIYIDEDGEIGGNGDLIVNNNGLAAGSYAGIPYDAASPAVQFNKVYMKEYGHLRVLGTDSTFVVIDEDAIEGDSSSPRLEPEGTLQLPTAFNMQNFSIDLIGDILGGNDLVVGSGTIASTLRLYAQNSKRVSVHSPNHDIYNNFSNITVKNLSTVYLNSYDGNGTINNGAGLQDYGVTLNLSGDLNIETGGAIRADALGHGVATGPSGGCSPAHGGYAYNNSGAPYGSVKEPITLGSGGCNKTAAGGHISHGGTGGGAIKITVGGTATVSGTLSANGSGNTKSIYTAAPSTGAGGSIWLTAATLNGSGLISADGGIGSNSYGAGGGRIAIYELDRGTFPIGSKTNLRAFAGGNGIYGGPGTIYLDEDGQTGGNGDLRINANNINASAATIPYDSENPVQQFNKIYLKEQGHLRVLGVDSTLLIANEEGIEGDATAPDVQAQGILEIPDAFIINGVTLDIIGDIVGGDTLTVGNGTIAASFTIYANTAKRYSTKAPNHDIYSNFDNITVKNLSSMTLVSYDGTGTNNNATGLQDYGITLNLSGNLTVETGGIVSSTGYGIGGGPSGGCFAAHGGYAYNGSGVPYGDVKQPIHMGSGGCSKTAAGGHLSSGGNGGGAIKLTVGGTTTINGILHANGTGNTKSIYTAAPTSGAGGSIWLIADTINGSGVISANGGIGNNSLGSGGGRIAIYESQRGTFPVTNRANIQAFSGGNSSYGGAGTIYLDSDGQLGGNGDLWINNANRNTQYAAIPYDESNPVQQFNRIFLKEYGALKALGIDATLLIEGEEGIIGDNTAPRIAAEGILSLAETFNIDGVTLDIIGDIEGGENLTVGDGTKAAAITLYAHNAKRYETRAPNHDVYDNFQNLTLKNLSTMTLISYDGSGTANNAAGLEDYGVTFRMANNLVVESGATITTNGSGYTTAQGPGTGCGPAYGGYGASNGGTPYGSVKEPIHLGSGGCTRSLAGGYVSQGGTGGGAIKFEIDGTFTLDGTINANGTGGIDNAFVDGASGTGGSVWVIADRLDGSGIISANGGTRSGNPIGGSGGRIAIYESERGSFPITNKSNLQAFGGAGSPYGGPGTIYLDEDGELEGNGELLINNNGANSSLAAIPYDSENPIQEFTGISLKEYGGLRAMGIDGTLVISSETGIEGDATAPQLEAEGILSIPETFTINGVTLDIVGDLEGGSNLTVGDGITSASLKLYAKTDKRVALHSPNQDIYNFENLNISDNAKLEIYSFDGSNEETNNGSGLQDYGVTINVAQNLNLSTAATIDGIGKGYGINQGPSGGCSASHGGYSGLGNGTVYGDLYAPVALGSGGCTKTAGAGNYVSSGGIGGSALKLAVQGDVTLDGTVKFDGTPGSRDATNAATTGAGGSFWIEANTINGQGTITANGGSLNGANGAGGGRIAIYEKSRGSFPVTNKSNVQAFGGGNSTYGGAGTIYIDADGLPNGIGDLILENNNRSGRSMDFEGKDYNFRNLSIGQNVTSKVLSTLDQFPSDYDYPTPQEASSDNNTVALYHLNETTDGSCVDGQDLCDSSESIQNLTNHGTVYSNGIYSYGRKFDGQGYLEGNFNHTLGDVSISLWVKSDGYDKNGTGGNALIAINDTNYNSIELVPQGDVVNSNTAEIVITWGGQQIRTGHIIDLLWHHLVVTYDSNTGNLKLYVDSVLVSEASFDPGISIPTSLLSIGKGVGESLRFKGSIDEVLITNKAYSNVEVNAFYKGMNVTQLERILGRGALFNLSGSFTLAAGAKLDAKGTGYPSGQGPGAGASGSGQTGGAGAGHGGNGGVSESDGLNTSANGGSAYGTQRRPFTLGSGGGSAGTGALGGNGGGSVAIKARSGFVDIDGIIDVSGDVGKTASPGGGGGSGGSILIEGQTCDITGSLLANGGNGGNDIYDGGGGGGGRISVLYTQGPCDVSGTVSYVSGDSENGQSGQIGTYPSISSIPAVPAFKEQYKSDGTTEIPVGGLTPEQIVTLKSNVSDPSATAETPYELVAEFEVVGIAENFTALNTYKGVVKPALHDTIFAGVFTTPSTEYAGGEALISEVQIPNLTPGEQYKWRVRVVNQDTQVAGQWTEFGDNGSNQADFTVTNTSEIQLEASKSEVDVGEYFSLTTRALDIFGNLDELYTGTVSFSSDTELVDLPSNYEFGPSDGGEHEFSNSIRFLTAGTHTVSVQDVDAPTLVDEIEIVVNALPVDPEDEEPEEPENPVSGPTDEENPTNPISSPTGNSDNCTEDPDSIECVLVSITNVTTEIINENSVKVCYQTNIPTVGVILYGESTNNVYTNSVFGPSAYATSQCIEIDNLEYDIGYIFEIRATAQSGRDDTHEGVFSTNPELVVERTNDPVLQCISHDSKDYSFNSNGEVTLRYTTSSDSMCTVFYGNDPQNLEYRSTSNIPSKTHRSTLNLTVLDGERDLFYRIECGENENLCTNSAVIPVSEYMEYYRPRAVSNNLSTLVGIGLGTLITATLLVNLAAYPNILTLMFPWLLKRRKGSTWGIVTDKKTKKAIPFATVSIYNSNNKFIKSEVTGFDGKYGFIVDRGVYTLEVKHSDYQNEKAEIEIEKKEDIAAKNFELTRLNVPRSKYSKFFADLRVRIQNNLLLINRFIVLIGFSFSLIAFIQTKSVISGVILVFYGIQFAWFVYSGINNRKWGYVYDSKTNARIKGASVRIYSIIEKRQLEVELTDGKGRFGFKIAPGKYYITVDAKGYKVSDSTKAKYIAQQNAVGNTLLFVDRDKKEFINISIGLEKSDSQKLTTKFGQ